jgi:hypothetical protein
LSQSFNVTNIYGDLALMFLETYVRKRELIDLLMYFTTNKSLLNRQIQDMLPFVVLCGFKQSEYENEQTAYVSLIKILLHCFMTLLNKCE